MGLINCLLLFKILLVQQWINYLPKLDPKRDIKPTEKIWMDLELIR